MTKANNLFNIKIIFLSLFMLSACQSSAGFVSTISARAFVGAKYLVQAVHDKLGITGSTIAGCLAAATCLYAWHAVYERYNTLPTIECTLTPPAGENTTGNRKHLYTWTPEGIDVRTIESLRHESTIDNQNNPTENLNESRLIAALRRDCTAFDIFKHDDVEGVQPGTDAERNLKPIKSGEIHWNDLVETLEYEIRQLRSIKDYLLNVSHWRLFWYFSVGAERDRDNAYRAQQIMTKEDERHMTGAAENAVNRAMIRPVSIKGRILAAVFGSPNYDKVYSLYWQAYRRLLWLETFQNIVRTAALQVGMDKVFVRVHAPGGYAVDPNAPVQILVPGHPVQRAGAQAQQDGGH